MSNISKKRMPLFKKRSAWAFVFVGLVFIASIYSLFTRERRKLNAEFAGIVTGSLNIHTQRNAAEIDRMAADAERALRTAEAMLRHSGMDESIEERLNRRNEIAPDYPTEYLSAQALAAGTPHTDEAARARLARGETVVDILCDDGSAGYYLSVMIPLLENGGLTGALYTRFDTKDLFHDVSESTIYQGTISCLVTGDGSIVFNTYQPEHRGNLFDDLGATYGLTQAEIDRIAGIVDDHNAGASSATFLRKGQTYFVSSAYLGRNDWHLVSVVRGSDVVLRSSAFFQDVVRTGLIAILITAAAACVIFFRLLATNRRLEEEQRRNRALVQRLRAMFEQHSALKVLFDAATGEIIDVNPAILRYFGYTKEEVMGRGVQEFNLLPPDIQTQRMQGELNGEALYYAAPHRLRSGETRLLDVHASVILDEGRRLLYAILVDVTDREHYRDELIQEKELLRTTLRSIGDGVVTTDNLGFITGINAVAEHLTGWDSEAAVGRPFADVFILQNEDTGLTVENPIQKVLETGRVVGLANHTELVDLRGARTPITDSAAPIRSENGTTFGVVMVFRDVSDEKAHSRQIELLSYHDVLTGLHNRRYIEERMARPDVAEQLPVSVIMADVNGLKITNDVFGHKAGDALLKSVAGLMRQYCEEGHLVARWGGDEFVILLPKTALEAAEALIQKIKGTHIEIEGSSLYLSLSLGCACKDGPRVSIQTALQHAEENMYRQKLLDGKSYRNAIISTLLATLYEKSNETQAHSKRLETYCHAIGQELGLSSKDMDELSLLALLHDIGKVGIHPNLLKKPSPLTRAEHDEMKRHPEIGYRIAQATPELAAVADLILSHHERWDGGGYPRGLKGADIPLACRILSLVDAFDAMTHNRVYRCAMSVDEAVLEVKRSAGRQFDPGVADVLIGIVEREQQRAMEGALSS